jgi:hypothetical protein
MTVSPPSDGKRIAQWGAAGLDIAILVAFAIIFSGNIRLAVLAFLGLVLTLNTIWLVWSTQCYAVLRSDVDKFRSRYYDKRYAAGLLEGFSMRVENGDRIEFPIMLKPPHQRAVAMKGDDPLEKMPDLRCTVRKSWHRTQHACGPAGHNNLGMIVAAYPDDLLRAESDLSHRAPIPGTYIARWSSAHYNGRLPRKVMRWSDNGFRYHPVRRVLMRWGRLMDHLRGLDGSITM